MITFLVFLFYHLIENSDTFELRKHFNNDEQRHNGISDKDKDNNDFKEAEVSSQNLIVVIMTLCSFTFVVYVLVLDCIAVVYRHTRVDEVIFFKPMRSNTAFGDVKKLFE